MQSVTLVVVDTPEAEASLLEEIEQFAVAFGMPVAPVLDRAALPQRLKQALNDAGCEVRFMNRGELALGTRQNVSGVVWPERPAAVLASDGVPAEAVSLAAALCRVVPEWLAEPPRIPTLSALVLVNPEVAQVSDVAPALAALARQRVRVGVLYTLDPIDSRLAILKSLLLDRIEGNGVYTVLFADADPASDGGPANLQYASSAEGRRRFISRQDLLLVNGHANPLDAALGAELGLCARAGSEAPSTSGRAFSCFQDGRCFRQPFMGRQPEDRAGLVRVRDAKASFLVLSGCNVAALGKAWFDARHGLAYQCQQQCGLASAVTNSVALGRLEFDLLFVSLAAEGLPLGEVVGEVNRVRTEVYGQASAYAPGVGPFVLLGNPLLRLTGFDVQETAAVNLPSGALAINLANIRFDADGSALLRVPVPVPAGPAPHFFLQAAPETVWCRGIWYPGPTASWLYLWLSTRDEKGRCEATLQLKMCDEDPAAVIAASAEHCLQQVPYWMVALRTFCDRWGQVQPVPGRLETALSVLPEIVRDLSLIVTALRPPLGVLTDERHTRAIARGLWTTMNEVGEMLLECLVDSACRFGTLPLASWEVNFRRLEKLGSCAPCACGSPVAGQRYRYPDGGPLQRANYQCPLCGPIGEDDGRRLLRVTHLNQVVTQGGDLSLVAECNAPDDEVVQVHAVALLESVFRDRRMVGDVVTVVTNPGKVREFSLHVSVPEDLASGVYPCALLGVVNGAAYLVRQLVEVILRPADDPDTRSKTLNDLTETTGEARRPRHETNTRNPDRKPA